MTCPNCGQEFEGARCPHCGRPKAGSGGRNAAVVVAVLLVFPSAVFGACAVMLGVSDGGRLGRIDPFAVVGFGALVVAIALGVWCVKLWKS